MAIPLSYWLVSELQQKDVSSNVLFISKISRHGNIDAIRQIVALVPTDAYATSPVLNAINNAGQTGIHAAAAAGNVESLKFLTGGHSTILAMALTSLPTGELGQTPLHVAAERGLLDVMKVLIKSRCDVDRPGKAARRLQDVVHGFDMALDKEGRTALMMAAHQGHVSAVSELLQVRRLLSTFSQCQTKY